MIVGNTSTLLTSSEILPDCRPPSGQRLAPYQLNAYHPRSLSYFTPPPLAMSVLGELLAQVTQQGVDVWHAGPSGAFVEEEVVHWLCDLVGYDSRSFGLLTSGGVMANFMGEDNLNLFRRELVEQRVGEQHTPGAA